VIRVGRGGEGEGVGGVVWKGKRSGFLCWDVLILFYTFYLDLVFIS